LSLLCFSTSGGCRANNAFCNFHMYVSHVSFKVLPNLAAYSTIFSKLNCFGVLWIWVCI
jgi:hypothetical protein